MAKFISALALGLVLVFPFAAAHQSDTAPNRHYFQLSDFDLRAILPPPPAPGSLAAQADLEAVLQAQSWRTPDQVSWAQFVDKKFFETPSMGALGPWFNEHDFPRTYALMREVDAEEDPISEAAKKLFLRDRPFKADPRVHPCVTRLKTPSYPSGHAFGAYLWAAVLSDVFPAHAAEIREQAERVAWGRILGGAHFPSDDVGGRILAEAVAKRLEQSPEYVADLAKCREEASHAPEANKALGADLVPAGAAN